MTPPPGPHTGSVVGVDVGGTSIKGAVVDAASVPRVRRRTPTPVADGVDAVVAAVAGVIEGLRADAVAAGLAPPTGAGVVVPGTVDERSGIAGFAANIGWRDLPLAGILTERLAMPVALGHDVRAGGLAEARLGAGRGARDLLFLALGTGIAAAAVVDGHLLTAGGYAGEVGHVTVEPDGEPCGCGGRGCLERIASAAAVARRYAARSGRPVTGSEEVAGLVRAGDPVARAVWDEAIDALAAVTVASVTLLGSEVVVVGGGLAEADELLLPPLAAVVDARLTFQRRPRFVRAALGEEAACLGASLLAWDATKGTEGRWSA